MAVLATDPGLFCPIGLHILVGAALAAGIVDFLWVVGKTVGAFVMLGHGVLLMGQF